MDGAMMKMSTEIADSSELYAKLQKDDLVGVYVTCLDIKGLNEINNVYGREVGNKLLQQIVNTLKEFEEKGSFRFYFVEGNHFALLMKGLAQEDAIEISNHVYKRFDDFWRIGESEKAERVFCRVNMGIMHLVELPSSYLEFLDLLERVEYFSTKEDRLIYYDEQKNQDYEKVMKRRIALRESILNDMKGFSLMYQPLMEVQSNRWIALEALCRWDDPELGSVKPDIFIPEAEELGLIHLLGNWIFETAISQIKKWKLDELNLFTLFINLSSVQLKDYDMLDKLSVLLEEYQFPPYKLVLDITGTPGFQFDRRIINYLQEIQMKGITLALEDFEVGRAAFSNIRNLPVYMVKTDRDFIKNLDSDVFIQQTLRLMVDYAHSTGLLVIAEGVETEEQRRIVTEKGANLIQGFYCSRPLTVAQLECELDRFYFK
jgi:EAL domain-containing protein (putative c-di-GMP-specific phosphodiesterase class I)/GGDEF domain-containing protein